MISQLVIELKIAQTFNFAAFKGDKKGSSVRVRVLQYNRVQMIARHDIFGTRSSVR